MMLQVRYVTNMLGQNNRKQSRQIYHFLADETNDRREESEAGRVCEEHQTHERRI